MSPIAALSPRLAALLTLLLLTACGPEPPAPEAVRPAVTQRVTLESGGDRDRYTGEIHARYETQLAFRVAGKVVERAVELGDPVEKGQLLARLDARDMQLAAEAAEAAWRAARDQRDLAESEFRRAADLLARKLVSQSVYDARKADFEVARSRLQEAARQLQLRRNQLAYTQLRADHAGTITMVQIEPGQVVAAGQPALGFARAGERELWIDLPENRVDSVQTGQAVRVTLWALPKLEIPGVVREIASDADPASRTYRVRIRLQDPGPQVRLGMTGTAQLVSDAAGRVAVLPATSLYHDGDKPAVWVVDPKTGKVALQPVQIRRYRDNEVVLDGGLTGGELVVVKGAHKLHAGQQVRPVEALEAGVEAGRDTQE